MTTVLTQPKRKRKRLPGRATVFGVRLVLFWEKIWPAILPALAIPFAYCFLSLFDLWRLLPDWAYWAIVAISAAGFAGLAFRDLAPVRFPSRRAAKARLEEDGDVPHDALQSLDDTPFTKNKTVSPLWRAHMEAQRERAAGAKLSGVRAFAEHRDPWGLRYTALGLLTVALIAAGADAPARLALGPGGGLSGSMIADVWIEPPVYANRAPIYLMRAGAVLNRDDANAPTKQTNVPAGSVVVAQINGGGRARLSFQTDDETHRAEFERNDAAGRAELPLSESGLLRLSVGGVATRWPVGVIGDDAPLVAFLEPPSRTDDARLDFTVAIEDDYGIVSATLELQLDPAQERALDAPDFSAEALGEKRTIALEGVTGQSGERAITLDLQSDPWAGLGVLAAVSVADGAGQVTKSEAARTTLPVRSFFNPVAKAVIEQRQTLAVAAADWTRAARSFDAMTLAPEIFYSDKPTDYLLLRSAFWRIMRQNGDSFDDAVEKFWPLALQLEDEALALMRQRLDAAQEALRQALERGASDEEIARLVENLRQAMNDYLAALANSGQTPEGQAPQNAQQLDQSDLDEMLDAIRDLSEQGAANAARQMLSDLENLLNNLQLTQGGSGSGQGQQSGQGGASGEGQSGASGEAGELIGRQRELADETFERGRDPTANGDDLAGREGGLGGDLDELIDSLKDDPEADPDGEAARALERARSAMREAEGALSGDDFSTASNAMERAIDNLRNGADMLAREQMRQARGDDGEAGEGQRSGEFDPLGRPSGDVRGEGVDVPGLSDAGRTRAFIEELRKRLSEPGRSEEEIEYLERLLERF